MIETLVAIAILMISIAGPLTIVSKGLNSAIYAHDQVTASYLAQDAMEYVKNTKDYNLKVVPANWLNWLSTCTDVTCSVNTINNTPYDGNAYAQCLETACLLYLSSTGYSPVSGGATATKFTRTFTLKNVKANEATAVVEVSWKNGIISNTVTYENEIYNVYK
jgi:type II secretory pathway pseudopilin PulG